MTGYIYKITCLITNEIYIGMTTRTIEERFKEHIREAQRERDNRHFHNAIRKYGEQNFTIEKLCSISMPTREELNKQLAIKEVEYINEYNSFENGYNETYGGEGVHGRYGELNPFFGRTHSLETKQQIGEKSRERKAWKKLHTPEAAKKRIETRKNNGLPWFTDYARQRAKVVNTGRKQTKDEIIRRVESVKAKRKINPDYGKIEWTPELRKKDSKSHGGKDIIQMDLKGNIIKKWNGLYEIHKELGYDSSCICKCCRGKMKRCYGFTWKYAV